MTDLGSSGQAIMAHVERAVSQNLLDFVRAVNTVAPDLGATATACAGGLAAFVGMASPLTTIKGAGPEITDVDIDSAEAFYRGCHAGSATFEVAPWISAASAERLQRRGYVKVGAEDVVVRYPPFEAPLPLHPVVPIQAKCWPELMLRMYELPADTAEWRALAEAAAVLPDAIRLGIRDSGGEWLACAELLPATGVGLFANDATLCSARRRGAQTATIHARLRAISSRAFSCAAAEVAAGSSSERNYQRCGFHLAYSRVHYSRKL